MKTALTKCPVCDGELTVTRLHCDTCDTVIEGRFANSAFAGLTPEQMDFIETFVRCEGKLTRLQDEMALSYPTVRNRLQEVIRRSRLRAWQGGNCRYFRRETPQHPGRTRFWADLC